MGVWETLIGLTASALKERPRKEVLQRLVELRNAMIGCQKSYDDYQSVLKEGDYDSVMEKRAGLTPPAGAEFTILYDPRSLWRQAVFDLEHALSELNDVLIIFSPEAGEHLRFYGVSEALETRGHV